MRFKNLSIALVSVAVAACSFDGSGAPAGDTTRERLNQSAELVIESDRSMSQVMIDWSKDDHRDGHDQIPLVEGRAFVYVDRIGRLVIDELDLLGDDKVVEDDGGILAGARVTDLRLRSELPIVADTGWSDDGKHAYAEATATLLFDWSLVDDDGDVLPLATQRFRDVQLHFHATLSPEGHLEVELVALRPGVFFQGGILRLADLTIDALLRD